jgi:hypothetical protein
MAMETFGVDFERYLQKFTVPPTEKEDSVFNPTLEIPLHTSYLKDYHIRVSENLALEDRSIGAFFDYTNELKQFEDFVSSFLNLQNN